MSQPILIVEELPTANGRAFGVATLNAPASLNALSLEMATLLISTLREWAKNDNIAGVVLQGAGPKGFCAGGDVRALYHAMAAGNPEVRRGVAQFFEAEYTLDYSIHTYPKPLLCWGHGVVMGGGIGMMVGASHRVVTETSRMAMPEITIGLYPDVAASWFLQRMPGKVGTFLSLTGAQFNSADALFIGLADFAIANERKQHVLDSIQATDWGNDSNTNKAALSRILEFNASQQPVIESLPEASSIRKHIDDIHDIVGHERPLLDIAQRLRVLAVEDSWIGRAAKTFVNGSPSSAVLSYELLRRAKHLSLADVFRLEYTVSVACSAAPDFAEGVRALLIDKDKNPKWVPARIEDVDSSVIAGCFETPPGPHPLAGLNPLAS